VAKADTIPQRKFRGGTRATMADVARLAGVSEMTISRVIRTPERVARRTRESVHAAMRQVGYLPNSVAGSLASNRTRLIGVIVPTISNSVFADTVQGLQDVLRAHGYQVLLAASEYSDAREEELLTTVVSRCPDGLVLTGITRNPGERRLLRLAGVPVVETWELGTPPFDVAVGFNNRAAAEEMVLRLDTLGYRNIAHVTSAAADDTRAAARRDGYTAAVTALGRHAPFRMAVHAPGSVETGRRAYAELRDARPEIDAVFFVNDMLAIGALCEARERGEGARIGIAGFGDAELSRHLEPALTTVRVPRYDIGYTAAWKLLERLEPGLGRGDIPGGPVVDVGYTLVERASTPPRLRAAGG